MAEGVWKGVHPKVIGRSEQLLLNKISNQNIPSMRNVDAGEKKEKKREKNGENSGPLT